MRSATGTARRSLRTGTKKKAPDDAGAELRWEGITREAGGGTRCRVTPPEESRVDHLLSASG